MESKFSAGLASQNQTAMTILYYVYVDAYVYYIVLIVYGVSTYIQVAVIIETL